MVRSDYKYHTLGIWMYDLAHQDEKRVIGRHTLSDVRRRRSARSATRPVVALGKES
jgi:hypothetical protein